MKNMNSLSIFVIAPILILVCNTAWSQDYKEYKKSVAFAEQITNGAQWENITRDKVYNNCITALHLQGFELEPIMTSKESGLIVTKTANFYPPIWKHNWIGGEYFLNILVYETESNKISINLQIKGTKLYDYKAENGEFTRVLVQKGDHTKIGRFEAFELWNGLNNKVSDDIEQFLAKLESIQGKAISKTTLTLKWE
jgi:hypothetical protein